MYILLFWYNTDCQDANSLTEKYRHNNDMHVCKKKLSSILNVYTAEKNDSRSTHNNR